MTGKDIRRVERVLREYPRNVRLCASLREEISRLRTACDVHAQDYAGRVMSTAGNADPVSSYVQRLMSLEHRAAVLERYTRAVRKLQVMLQLSTDRMSVHYLLILEEYYFCGVPASRLLEATGWSRSTFYSRRLSVIGLAADYLEREC